MTPYTIGMCINCGKQALVTNPSGMVVGPLAGTKLILLKLSGAVSSEFEGKNCMVGTLPLCSACAYETMTPEDVKGSIIRSPLNFFPESSDEWKCLTDLSIVKVAQF